MESCSLSSYLKFLLDIHTFEKLTRQNNHDQQPAALTLFHRYLSMDAKYFIPIDDEIRQTTLCKIFFIISYFIIRHFF
jgi:hypothetical protein